MNGGDWSNDPAAGGANNNGCGNYATGHLLGFGLSAIAFEGDDPNTANIFNDSTYGIVTRLSSRFLPQVTSGCYASGFPSESYSYGSGTILRLAQTLWAFQTAGKSSLIGNFDVHPLLQQIALSTIYAEHPDNWGINEEGDWAGQYVGILGQGLPYVISGMLGNSYAEGGYALYQYSQISLNGVPGGAPLPSYGYALDPTSAFLYYQPAAAPTSFNSALPLYRFGNAPGDFHTFIRSDWTSAALYTTFNGGNGRMTGHQSKAFGHLYVQRGADRLLVNAGQWAGTAGVNGATSFTGDGWGGNTLFLSDPTMSTSGEGYGYPYCDPSRIGYGCVAGGTAVAPTHKESSSYFFSKVNLGSAYGNRGNYPLSTYYRSFVNIGGVSFVYDYSVAMNYVTAVRKQFWHTPALTSASFPGIASAINISGNSASATVGSSTLWIKALLPTNPTITSATDLLGYVGPNAGATQRFEVGDPAQISTPVTRYLTVLVATASTVSVMPSTQLIDAGTMKGAIYDDGVAPKVVLFSADGKPKSSVSYAAPFSASLPGRHVVCDLAAGMYAVTKDGAVLVASVPVGNDGSLAFDSLGGGQFVVARGSGRPTTLLSGAGDVHGKAKLN